MDHSILFNKLLIFNVFIDMGIFRFFMPFQECLSCSDKKPFSFKQKTILFYSKPFNRFFFKVDVHKLNK